MTSLSINNYSYVKNYNIDTHSHISINNLLLKLDKIFTDNNFKNLSNLLFYNIDKNIITKKILIENKKFNTINNNDISVILNGSYARMMFTSNSDVDISIISNKKHVSFDASEYIKNILHTNKIIHITECIFNNNENLSCLGRFFQVVENGIYLCGSIKLYNNFVSYCDKMLNSLNPIELYKSIDIENLMNDWNKSSCCDYYDSKYGIGGTVQYELALTVCRYIYIKDKTKINYLRSTREILKQINIYFHIFNLYHINDHNNINEYYWFLSYDIYSELKYFHNYIFVILIQIMALC